MSETKEDLPCRDVYISGPLFTPAERYYLEHIDRLCVEIGLSTYLPHRHAGFGPATAEHCERYFKSDLLMLKRSHGVVAVINGAVDSGTAWEIGFSFSLGKHLLGIREDIRNFELNPMIACTLKIASSFHELRELLLTWRNSHERNGLDSDTTCS